MFYLELKDGERFFTDAKSDDKLEFEKILEAKLGKDAASMFESLVDEAKTTNDDILESVYDRLSDCVYSLDHALGEDTINKDEIEDILSELGNILNILR